MLKTLLLPVDFSDATAVAVATARDLARELDAQLVVLHVNDLSGLSASEVPYMLPAMVEEHTRNAKARLAMLVRDLRQQGVRVRERFEVGFAREVIPDVARDERAELIVMGTHGRGAVAKFLLGSVAERVVRTASVPVLTVRPSLPI